MSIRYSPFCSVALNHPLFMLLCFYCSSMKTALPLENVLVLTCLHSGSEWQCFTGEEQVLLSLETLDRPK